MKEPCSVPLPAALLNVWHFREATRRARASHRHWPLPIDFRSQRHLAATTASSSSQPPTSSLLILPAHTSVEDLKSDVDGRIKHEGAGTDADSSEPLSGMSTRCALAAASDPPAASAGVLSNDQGDWPRGTPMWVLRMYEHWCRATFEPLPLPKPLTVEEEETMVDDTARLHPEMMDAARAWLSNALAQINHRTSKKPPASHNGELREQSRETSMMIKESVDVMDTKSPAAVAALTCNAEGAVVKTEVGDCAADKVATAAVLARSGSRGRSSGGPSVAFTLNALEVAALRRQPQFIERFFDTFPPTAAEGDDDVATSGARQHSGGEGTGAAASGQDSGEMNCAEEIFANASETIPPGDRRRAREADEAQSWVPLPAIEVERRARRFRVMTVVYPDIGDS